MEEYPKESLGAELILSFSFDLLKIKTKKYIVYTVYIYISLYIDRYIDIYRKPKGEFISSRPTDLL